MQRWVLMWFLILAACTRTVTVGHPFDTTKVASLQRGVTTKTEVHAAFGEPVTRNVDGSGGEVWIYHHMSTTGHATPFSRSVESTPVQVLVLKFDGDVLVNYRYTETSPVQVH